MAGKFLRFKSDFILFSIFLLLSFPLFYFVYKYGDPEPLAHDFFQYYRLYYNWDWHNVNAPFNMRLVGAFFVHLFYELNLFYDTAVAFDKYASWGFLKQVYFNAVFFNWLSVAATCVVIYQTVLRQLGQVLLSFGSGLLFLFCFGTLFYGLMPLTEGFSVLLFAITFNLYLRKNWWALLPLVLAVFQREYILMAFALIAFMDYWKSRSSFHLAVMIGSILLFVLYFVLRSTLFHTEALAFQTSGASLWHSFLHPGFAVGEYLRQLALTMNVFGLYVLLIVYKKWRSMPFDAFNFWKLVFLLLQIVLVSFAAQLGNNTGRYFYLISPLLILQLVTEVKALLNTNTFITAHYNEQ